MDRRTFLKSLVALGVATRMPIDPAVATDVEVDVAFEAYRDTWHLFEVADHGTLAYANFQPPETRRDAYDLGRADTLMIAEIEDNPVLAEVARTHYARKLEDRGEDIIHDDMAIDAEPDEDDWVEWLKAYAPDERAELNIELDQALDSPPDWIHEEDDLYETGNAQGAAYHFFTAENHQLLAQLGVVLIEGEHPGSSYFAAELRCPVPEANAVAANQGWPIRFIREPLS